MLVTSDWELCYLRGMRTSCSPRAEQHYCVTRKEQLAVMYFIVNFQPYFLGRRFMLTTNYGSHDLAGQHQRTYRTVGKMVGEFDFEFCH